MWNDGLYSHDMGGLFGFGHGLSGFHGLLWLVLLAIIVGAGIALIRDWRHDHATGLDNEKDLKR